MKKRYKIPLILFGAGIVVVGGVVLFGFALISNWATPSDDFDLNTAPSPPDYADDIFWAALPTKKDSSDVQPEGLDDKIGTLGLGVDVFYIHPTGYFSGKNWNAPLGHEMSGGRFGTRTIVGAMLAMQASALNTCGAVYAPHYRQATLTTFLQFMNNPDTVNGPAALGLAYSDVARAFDYFIEHFNEGRPFIIASHSQGTTHTLRLLHEKIDGSVLRDRMVVAYILGYKVPMDVFERLYKNLRPCEEARDTGCIVAWDTFGEGGQSSYSLFHWYPTGWEDAKGKGVLCMNPLNWSRSQDRGNEEAHKGRVDLNWRDWSGRLLGPVQPGQTWAQCQDGVLYVKDQEGYFSMGRPRDKNYHLYDYSLFYMDIRENAMQRSRAYLNKGNN